MLICVVCACVSVCVLQGCVGLLCCLVFVGLLRGMMRPEGEEQEAVPCLGEYDIMKFGWHQRNFF